ncbi:MAG: recombination mediator RecR [bacterium]
MVIYAESIEKLIEELKKLPGIGTKVAQRLAFHIHKSSRQEAVKLANAIVEVKNKIRYCSRCFNITEKELCVICSNRQRDHSIICVVEDPYDLQVIEKTGEFKGGYHILMGNLSPLDNVKPEDLKIRELMLRIKTEGIREVIVATNPTVVGDGTAMYIARELRPLGVKVTRIARGLPVGGDLEYTDMATLSRALEGRTEV